MTPWSHDMLVRYMISGAQIPNEEWASLTDDARDSVLAEVLEVTWRNVRGGLGVPTRLFDACLDGRSTPALDRMRTYLEVDRAEGRCLVLTGPTGVGKTYAAVAAMRRYPKAAQRFWYFPSLCGALLDPARRAETLAAVKATRFVVLDDFGVEYVKEGGLVDTFLDEIVWHREAHALPTVITTNLTTAQLKDRLSDRLVDRLRGDWGRIFECPGESLR